MKNVKYFFGMLLIASVVSLVSCDKDPVKPPLQIEADYPEAPKVDGKITIFAKFEGGVCGDVVLAGSYKMKPGSTTAWSETPSELEKFVSAGTINGKDWGALGWYKVTVSVPAPASGSVTNILGAKPVHLEGGEFDWSFQVGYKDHNASLVEVKDGDVEIVNGYDHECNIFFTTNKTAAIIFKTWKSDPCKVVRRNYTFNVTVPEGTPENAEVYLVGDMNKWTVDATKLTKGGDGKYSVTMNNVREGSGYKYVLNKSWDFEELAAIAADADCAEPINNRVTGASTTINDKVENWRKVTAYRCGENTYPSVDAEPGKITVFAKFDEEVCEDIVFMGSHISWNAELPVADMPKFELAGEIDGTDWGAEGWYKVTITLTESAKEDGYLLNAKPVQLKDGKFFWDYQVGFDDESDVTVKSGQVDVKAGFPGECSILFKSNSTAAFIFKKWKNNPCVVVPKHNYTFTVTVPAATGNADVRIVGGFGNAGYPNWKENADEMKLTKGADGKYSITLNNVEEGTEYKYVLNGTWDNEEMKADCEKVANRKTGTNATINDEVKNWKGYGDCIPEEPVNMYIIGTFADWNWKSDKVITMTPVHSHNSYWTITHFAANTEFKFAPVKDWVDDFGKTGDATDDVYAKGGDNIKVTADGYYLIYVDLEAGKIFVGAPSVYLIGECSKDAKWEAGVVDNKFVVGANGLTATTFGAGKLRMYATCPLATGVDWWQMEFNIFGGKIEYRGDGGDQAAVTIEAGKTITLEFKDGTGKIE